MTRTLFGATLVALCGALLSLGTPGVVTAQKKAAKKGGHEHAHHHQHEELAPVGTEAVAVLNPTKGNDVQGTITVVQQKGHAIVSGVVRGLSPGKHGFHIHQFGDLRAPDGTSAGGHYDPEGHQHGGLETEERHIGDLGNIVANEQGVAEFTIKAPNLNVWNILGRSFVVHAGADDLKSQPAGDSGPRVAVGVIGVAEAKKTATQPAATKK